MSIAHNDTDRAYYSPRTKELSRDRVGHGSFRETSLLCKVNQHATRHNTSSPDTLESLEVCIPRDSSRMAEEGAQIHSEEDSTGQ